MRIFRRFIIALFPLIKPLIMIKNRIKANRRWVVVLGGTTYSKEINQHLWELGYKVYLFDAAPKLMNWRFAAASTVLDIFDRNNVAKIVETANRLNCRAAFIQSDDRLLPILAEVNHQLKSAAHFSKKAIEVTTDKELMRKCFVEAGMDVPQWERMQVGDDLTTLPMPCLIKPLVGQGAKGVAYVADSQGADAAVAFIRDEMQQDCFIVEEFLPDRQFNVDGVIMNGEPFFHMITEEHFTDFVPVFKPCWYFFEAGLPDCMRAEILRETRAALAAADFKFGAFHLELKFKGSKAHTYDMANRMASNFAKYIKHIYDVSPVQDYVDVMHGEMIEQGQMKPKRIHLTFYNYPERTTHGQIDDLAQTMADAGELKLVRDGILLELTADKEETLRRFLKEAYAFRDNN